MAILAGVTLLAGAAPATTRRVGQGEAFATIAAAIAAAVDGDTILIATNLHTEAGIAVDRNVTIAGLGKTATIVQAAATRSNATARVFTVTATNTTIRDMTIRHGFGGNGGGIDLDAPAGATTQIHRLINCNIVSNDTVGSGGGVRTSAGNFPSTWVVSNSTFAANAAAGRGGGLFVLRSGTGTPFHRLTVCSSSFLSNRSGTSPGGAFSSTLQSTVGEYTFRNSTFHGNSAAVNGGGFTFTGGTNFILNSTIAANTAGNMGGGLRPEVAGTVVIVRNSIISDNIAQGVGGGGAIHRQAGTVIVTNSLIRGTIAGAVTTTGCLIGLDPLLSPPADNGGPTRTRAIAINSPARNAANPVTALPTDQRGVPRDSAPDMGAFEFIALPGNQAPTVQTAAAANPATVTTNATALSVLGADDGGEPALTYTWAATGAPPAPVSFSVNGNNAARNTTASFTRAGSYTLQATIQDAGGLSVASSVGVTVTDSSVYNSVYNVVPYAESFEDLAGWGGVYGSVLGHQGWHSSAPANDRSRIANLLYTISISNRPLPSATHTNVLQLDTRGGTLINSFGPGFAMRAAPTYFDMLMQFVPRRNRPVECTVTDTGLKFATYVNAGGNLTLYHGVAAADGTILSNTVTATTQLINTTNWYRLTVTIDATATGSAVPLAMYQVNINGVTITNAAGYADGWKAQFDANGQLPPTSANGTWFRTASSGVNARTLLAATFGGTGYLDELVVTTDDPLSIFRPTHMLTVTRTGKGRSSLGLLPYETVSIMAGGRTQIVYTADDWYRIGVLTSNGAPVSAAAGARVFTQDLVNVAAAISNYVSFAEATPEQTGYADVPTSWLKQWREADVHSGLDAFDVRTKYLLGLDPTAYNTFNLAIESIDVMGNEVRTTVKRAVTGNLSPDGQHGYLKLMGAHTPDGPFTNLVGTALTGSAVFDSTGRRTYTNTVDGASQFFLRAIVE